MKAPVRLGIAHRSSKVLSTLIGVLAAVVLIISACGKKEEAVPEEVIRPVKTTTVSAGELISGVTLPGKVRASQRVELAFKEVGGRLVELPIEGREGQAVEVGELLARIDPQDFETNLRNVQGRLKEARAGLELAKAEYARVKRIQSQDSGAISGADIDRKREAVNATEGRIRSLRAAVDDAKNQLSYTFLKAPFAGLIARRYVDNFQEVKPKQPILSLEDVSHVELLIDVPENIIAGARSPNAEERIKAVAEFPTARGQKFELMLKEFATRADSATQTYQVVMQMPQPEGINVFPGMTATVTLRAETTTDRSLIMILPAIAVLAEPDGKSFVWIVDTKEMRVHKQEIKVGAIEGSENIDVLEGLKGGETIAVAGVLKLQEGMKVRLWEQQ